MKKNLLILSLALGLAFTGCQSDATSENPEEVVAIQNALKEKKHDPNKLHMPLRNEPDGELSANLHMPQIFKGALSDCDEYHHYHGGENIMVLEEAPQKYHGELNVSNIEVNDEFKFCGSAEVNNNVKINFGGVYHSGGDLAIKGDLTVIYGGHLVVEGRVVVKGDLELGKGASLHFLGDDSSIEVKGKAKVHPHAIVQGEFEDVSNKIK